MSSPSSSPLRQEMVSSAVAFLSDPKVHSSSVAQRIAFLESKGLSSQEIDEALRQVGLGGGTGAAGGGGGGSSDPNILSGNYSHHQRYSYPAAQQPYPPYPEQQASSRDWRDWFIMAVVSGAVGYGVIALARKYLFPHLQPPNQTILESDRDALTAKYDEVAATLAQLDQDTRMVKNGLELQKAAVDGELQKVEEALDEVRRGERSRKEEMDKIVREVEALKRDMPKLFESSSTSTTTSLSDLQSELKSLRSLLVSRASIANGDAANSTPRYGSPRPGGSSPPLSSGKPAIPAWQLASETPAKSSDDPVGTSVKEAGKEHTGDEKMGGYSG